MITTTDYSDYEDYLLGQRIKITQIALITGIIFWDNGVRRITQITQIFIYEHE